MGLGTLERCMHCMYKGRAFELSLPSHHTTVIAHLASESCPLPWPIYLLRWEACTLPLVQQSCNLKFRLASNQAAWHEKE